MFRRPVYPHQPLTHTLYPFLIITVLLEHKTCSFGALTELIDAVVFSWEEIDV